MQYRSRLHSAWGKVTVAAVTASLVLTGFASRVTTPVSAGVYACPDMAGPGGLPDGYVDGSDLAAFAAAKGAQTPNGDFNSDGAVDAIDQAMFVQVFGQSNFSCENYWKQEHSGTPACVDMNHDGYVDASDLSAFAAAKGSNDLAGDFNGDSQVNDVDQAILEQSLGTVGACGIVVDYTPIDPQPPIEVLPPEPPTGDATASTPLPIAPAGEFDQATPATTSNHLNIHVQKPLPIFPGTEDHQASGVQGTPDPATTPVDWIGPDAPGGSPVSAVTNSADDTGAVSAVAPHATTPVNEGGFLAGALAALGAIGAAIRALLRF